jgi:hypothetical protein
MRALRVVAIVSWFVLAFNCGPATAEDRIKVKGKFTGNFVPGPDTNGDGTPSAEGTNDLKEKNELGKFLVEYTAEVLPPLPSPVTCPSGRVEYPYDYDEGVATQNSTGDELFFSYTSARLCVNPTNGNYTFHGTANYTGGTGAFVGAAGVHLRRTAREPSFRMGAGHKAEHSKGNSSFRESPGARC